MSKLSTMGVGLGVYDCLTKEIMDPEAGESYPALSCDHDKVMADRCVMPGTEKVIRIPRPAPSRKPPGAAICMTHLCRFNILQSHHLPRQSRWNLPPIPVSFNSPPRCASGPTGFYPGFSAIFSAPGNPEALLPPGPRRRRNGSSPSGVPARGRSHSPALPQAPASADS